MAALPDTDRKQVWIDYMENVSRETDEILTGLNKADLRAAIDGLDDWLVANEVEANQALPQPARSQLTAKQKAALLMHVIEKRYHVSYG